MKIESSQESERDSSMESGEAAVIPWSSATDWISARGSLDASITIESSDCPIPDSDVEPPVPKSPLVLKPPGPDSGPCEIKIHFEQKFEICQVYVRSTARVYEIYYARSPRSGNEYLCTVRCGVAERDGKVLQTTCIEDVEESGDCSSGELSEESISNGGSTSNGEDGWVKIKVPEVGRGSLSDKLNSDQAENIQDLYEATAQISDVEPCSVLTIRLLSLQDKGTLYVDVIYVFVDPAPSSDSENDTALGGSSAQNSLMAMFVPTLLQLSKSGVSRVQDKHASNEMLKDDKSATGSKKTDQIDIGLHERQVQQQYADSKKIDQDTSESAESQQPTIANEFVQPMNSNTLPVEKIENTLEHLVSRVSRVEDILLRFEEKMLRPIESIEARLQRVELQLEKLTQNSLGSGLTHGTRISAPPFSCSESNSSSLYTDQSDFPTSGPSEIEKKEQLTHGTRISAPPFSCSESNSSSLYTDQSDYPTCGSSEIAKKEQLTHGIRISAPPFSCSESNSSSHYNDQSGYPTCGPSEIEKIEQFCHSMPDLPQSHVAKFQPSLVVSVPGFTYGEEEDDSDNMAPVDHAPCIEPKKAISVDDALAAALAGFLSAAANHPSVDIQATSGHSTKADKESQYLVLDELDGTKGQDVPVVESPHRESSQYTRVLTVKAPDFSVDEIGNEDDLNDAQSPSNMVSVLENEEKGHDDEMGAPSIQSKSQFTSAGSCDFHNNESAQDFELENGECSSVSVSVRRKYLNNRNLKGSSEVNATDGFSQGDDSCTPVVTGNVSASDLAEDSRKTNRCQIDDETNPGNTISDITLNHDLGHDSENMSEFLDGTVATSEECSKDEPPHASKSPRSSLLDFDFPILDVKFTPDVSSNPKSPLETLLYGSAGYSVEGPSVHDHVDGDGNAALVTVSIETTDVLPVSPPLVDVGVSGADEATNLQGGSPELGMLSSSAVDVNLI